MDLLHKDCGYVLDICSAAVHLGGLFALPLALCNEKAILYEPNGDIV